MAHRLKAINANRPKIKLGETVKEDELQRFISSRTGLNRSEVLMTLAEYREAIVFFGLAGRAVKLEGLGTYTPKIKGDGSFDINHRLDSKIRKSLNAPGHFTGTILNKSNIGQTPDEWVAQWNTENPGDPVIE